jgi:hypothetical protein
MSDSNLQLVFFSSINCSSIGFKVMSRMICLLLLCFFCQSCDKTPVVDENKLIKFVFSDHADKPEFLIPEKYHPERIGNVISFRFNYKTKAPVVSVSKALGSDEVSVRIFYDKNGNKNSYRYKRLIEEIKNKYGLDKVVSGAYKNTIKETIYVHVLDGGDDLVVLDIAPGLKAYRAYRKLIDGIEVDYSITKHVPPSEFLNVDKSVMDMISSFRKK